MSAPSADTPSRPAAEAAEGHASAAAGATGPGDPRALPVPASELGTMRVRRLVLPGERLAVRAMAPAVQAAAVAAGGFVAGAAVAGLVHRRQRRSSALARGRAPRGVGRAVGGGARRAEPLQIVGSRTLLVDVHLLGLPGGDR